MDPDVEIRFTLFEIDCLTGVDGTESRRLEGLSLHRGTRFPEVRGLRPLCVVICVRVSYDALSLD